MSDFYRDVLGAPPLQRGVTTFKTYTNQLFKSIGQLQVKCKYNDQEINHSFPVVEGQSLFGRNLMRKLKVDWTDIAAQCNQIESMNLNNILEEFKDIFSEPKGRISNFKARIILKDDAVPKFMKPRPIPFALQEKVDRELDIMEKSGVIERIEHSEWASPLVVVPKPNGRVRITGDFKNTVNSQLHITQYPIASPERIFHAVSGCQKFSKLDGSNAYHQMELEEDCKKFLVVNTHRGLYKYHVLPQGIASSPAIFQQFSDIMLQGVTQTGTYIDDVLSAGKSDADSLKLLREIFLRMRKYNYFLSKDKCEFLKDNVEFLGHILSKRGIHTSPRKIAAIEAIQPPKDADELSSFLGLVNFYSKFVDNFASFCSHLYRLTRSSVQWQWSKHCSNAFNRVKSALSSAPILVNYDPKMTIGVSADAASGGLGSVLFHRFQENGKTVEKPIVFASRVLSDCEKNYSQIEKEGLAIIFSLQKFYKYLCGRKFVLVTDHKPLLAIFGSKTALQPYAAARLHRWSVYLSQVEYDIEYRSTNDHGNADALSRLPLSVLSEDEEANEVNLIAHENYEVMPVTAKEVRNATAKDKVLSRVLFFLHSSWPSKEENPDLQQFFKKKEELSTDQGVILWGLRVVIPAALRSKLLTSLHESHAGIVKMKALVRQHMWWPDMDKDIKTLAKSCIDCCSSRSDPPSAPLHPWQFPEKAWQRLHIDLAGPLFGKMYLVVVDAHSKWPDVYDMNTSTTSSSVISKLRDCFTHFGLPEQLVSDNGRQFVSDEFQQFCKNNGIRHTKSSAYHPRTNGEAERFIQTFKRAMNSSKGDLTYRMQRFLFNYRSTPHATTCVSPSELLLGRRLRTLLSLVKPDVNSTVAAAQARQEKNYNYHAKSRSFEEEEEVWVKTYSKNESKWSLGKIMKSLGPVTYLVDVGGQKYKRHVDQIYPAMKLSLGKVDNKPKHTTTTIKKEKASPKPTAPESPKRRHLSEGATPEMSPSKGSAPDSPDSQDVFQDATDQPPDPSQVREPTPPRRSTRQKKKPDRFQSI